MRITRNLLGFVSFAGALYVLFSAMQSISDERYLAGTLFILIGLSVLAASLDMLRPIISE